MNDRTFSRAITFSVAALLLFWNCGLKLLGQETSTPSAVAKTLAADWSGTLIAGLTRLKLGLHFKLDSNGDWTGTMDSPDQNAFGIPMDSVALDGNRLQFEIKPVLAKFDGVVTDNPPSIEGSWTQGITVKVKLLIDDSFRRPKIIPKDSFGGDWIGHINLGLAKLAMAIHLSQDENGNWQGSMDSPDQGAFGIPIDQVRVEGKQMSCEIKSASASFKAELSDDAQTMDGTWKQGAEFSFHLKRSNVVVSPPSRPQTPKGPFPYRSEEVSFENSIAKIRLAGTLTLPEGSGPHPAIILITGSGPQNRDEEIEGHKVFFVIADYLTRKGIAVLRYDDRGVGSSTGVFNGATTMDFADDAMSAVEYLFSRSEIDAERIGLLGHSEGGLVAPIVEVKSAKVAFLVLMAAPGVNGEQVLYEQAKRIIAANGGSEELIAENRLVQEELFESVKTEVNVSKAAAKLAELTDRKAAKRKEEGWSDEKIEEWRTGFALECKKVNSPWFRLFLALDPADWLKRVKAPVLVINGELDTQVIPDQNFPAIENAFRTGGHSSYVLKRLPNLNHQLQTCKTGSPNEYRQIEETIAASALDTIGNWLISTTSSRR